MPAKLILLILLFACTRSNAQVLRGTWTGNYAQNFLSPILKLVIQFELINDSIIKGKSHLYYPNNGYELHEIEGRFRKVDSTVYFEETLQATSIKMAAPVIYYMKLSEDSAQWRLQGYWKWKTSKYSKYSKSNFVWLVKAKEIIAKSTKRPEAAKSVAGNKRPDVKPRVQPKQQTGNSKKLAVQPKPDLIPDPVVKERDERLRNPPQINVPDKVKPTDLRLAKLSEVQSVIKVKPEEKDSITIAIYDNGEIDDDSISVYFNDRLLKQQFRISAVPYIFRISLQGGRPSNEIKIIAENMGSIPPNTALMIITTKRGRHEVRLSSNLEKNAVVRFVVE